MKSVSVRVTFKGFEPFCVCVKTLGELRKVACKHFNVAEQSFGFYQRLDREPVQSGETYRLVSVAHVFCDGEHVASEEYVGNLGKVLVGRTILQVTGHTFHVTKASSDQSLVQLKKRVLELLENPKDTKVFVVYGMLETRERKLSPNYSRVVAEVCVAIGACDSAKQLEEVIQVLQ